MTEKVNKLQLTAFLDREIQRPATLGGFNSYSFLVLKLEKASSKSTLFPVKISDKADSVQVDEETSLSYIVPLIPLQWSWLHTCVAIDCSRNHITAVFNGQKVEDKQFKNPSGIMLYHLSMI